MINIMELSIRDTKRNIICLFYTAISLLVQYKTRKALEEKSFPQKWPKTDLAMMTALLCSGGQIMDH